MERSCPEVKGGLFAHTECGLHFIMALRELDVRIRRALILHLKRSPQQQASFPGNEDVQTAFEVLVAPNKRRITQLAPIGLLGAGTDSIVLATKKGIALKYSPPSIDDRFTPEHEYRMLEKWAPLGLAFKPLELINPPRRHSNALKKADKFLLTPRLTRDMCRDLVTVIAMEAADGTLASYLTSSNLPPEAIADAVESLLIRASNAKMVHNDAKADNIGFKEIPGRGAVVNFRFLDCRYALTGDFFPSDVADRAIQAGARRDALCLCASLLQLSERLPPLKASCARYIAQRIWPLGWKKIPRINEPSLEECTAESQRLWKRMRISLNLQQQLK